jgi:hypothetical protein
MFLSNLRFAPLQAIALGHPATTHSPKIDFVIVEEDYVGIQIVLVKNYSFSLKMECPIVHQPQLKT